MSRFARQNSFRQLQARQIDHHDRHLTVDRSVPVKTLVAEPGDRLRQRCTQCGGTFRSTMRMLTCQTKKSCHGATEIIGRVRA